MEERFWQPDGEKEEKDYLHKVFTWATKRNLWPVSFKAEENVDGIFNIVKKE